MSYLFVVFDILLAQEILIFSLLLKHYHFGMKAGPQLEISQAQA